MAWPTRIVLDGKTKTPAAIKYVGMRTETGCKVRKTPSGLNLNPRTDLFNHSPTGFEWGYAGSGPAQLALAILADFIGNDERAVALHQAFKFKVVTRLAYDSWSLTDRQIEAAIYEIEDERRFTETGE